MTLNPFQAKEMGSTHFEVERDRGIYRGGNVSCTIPNNGEIVAISSNRRAVAGTPTLYPHDTDPDLAAIADVGIESQCAPWWNRGKGIKLSLLVSNYGSKTPLGPPRPC